MIGTHVQALSEWEQFYNLSRPHGAFNAKAPYEGPPRTTMIDKQASHKRVLNTATPPVKNGLMISHRPYAHCALRRPPDRPRSKSRSSH